jgi:hypothetical protein
LAQLAIEDRATVAPKTKAKAKRERQKRKLLDAQNAAGKGGKRLRALEDAPGPALRPPGAPASKGGKGGKGKPNLPEGSTRKSASGDPICIGFNSSGCTFTGTCRYKHICWFCEGAHAGKDHRS